jgi:hypothetical protein
MGHTLHVCEFAVRGTSVPKIASLGLDRSLGVNVLVPIAHCVFVRITDDEIVNNTGVTLPKDLNTVEAGLLKADDIRDVGHVYPTLQLETSLAFRVERRLVLLHHELCLLLVGVDVFAA